jgi:cupin 2 domain-containing protein
VIEIHNLFADLPTCLHAEQINELLARKNLGTLRVERIVSRGQASPPDFWYDQELDEWVIVLAGSARVRFQGEEAPRTLSTGDYVAIPAHTLHRVEWTDPERATVWLAIHCSG